MSNTLLRGQSRKGKLIVFFCLISASSTSALLQAKVSTERSHGWRSGHDCGPPLKPSASRPLTENLLFDSDLQNRTPEGRSTLPRVNFDPSQSALAKKNWG